VTGAQRDRVGTALFDSAIRLETSY